MGTIHSTAEIAAATVPRRDDERPRSSDQSRARNDEIPSCMSQQLPQFRDSCQTSGSNLMFPVVRSSPAVHDFAVQKQPPATFDASPPPASFVASPPQTHARPRPLLPVVQQPVPPRYTDSKFVKFMRYRPNIRIHTTASVEVFNRVPEQYRTGQHIAEWILQKVDMKTLLLAQRVCTTFHGLVRYQIRLQRQLWFIDTVGATRADFLEGPDYVDPLIRRLRQDLDLFLHYNPRTRRQKILYMPTPPQAKFDHSPVSTWRNMLVMRTAKRFLRWELVIPGTAIIDLGVMERAPTFGLVTALIINAMEYGGCGIAMIIERDRLGRFLRR